MNFILFFIDFYYIFMETFLEFVAFFNKQSKIETYIPSKISIFHGKNAKTALLVLLKTSYLCTKIAYI